MRAFKPRLFLAALMALGLAACGSGNKTTSVPDDMSLGNPNAKVTVVEYASVACPVCGHWYKEVYPTFKTKYIDTGKIHYVFREMLVGGDSEVTTAASGFLLARCAGKDKYFAVTDAIFRSQPDQPSDPGLFSDPKGTLERIAQSAGLNENQFIACVSDGAALTALQNRVVANSKIDNVNSTPTFVINGKSMEPGYHPLADIDKAIADAQASAK